MNLCPQCRNVYSEDLRNCPSCNTESPVGNTDKPNKYPMVSGISTAIRIISVIAFIVSVFLIFTGNAIDRTMGISVFSVSIASYLSASVVRILIDIEKNTRK